MATWRMCIACGLPKATDTLSEHVILSTFPLQKWFGERASILRLISQFPHHFLSLIARKIKQSGGNVVLYLEFKYR
jgi:hypothetical protein